ERVVLEHEADLALAHVGVRRILAVEEHGAAVGHLQPRDDAQQRRLARARRTEQRDELAGPDVEVQVVAHHRLAKPLVAVPHFDTHWSPSSDGYVGRSPEGTRAGLGAARRSAREIQVDPGCLIASSPPPCRSRRWASCSTSPSAACSPPRTAAAGTGTR